MNTYACLLSSIHRNGDRLSNIPANFDVAIVGGGLAGLTLALQLNQASPELAIVVLEKSTFPPQAAAHKVGEATVEIGAHYLAHTLGLADLLEQTQLRKFGLRLFFGAGNHNDLAHADELGASNLLPAASYQLDRGLLETNLVEILTQRGVEIIDRCTVKQSTLNNANGSHTLEAIRIDSPATLTCRWLIDASGRNGFLKRQLNIRQTSSHRLSAAWFRLDTSIDVDTWSTQTEWKNRCHGNSRRLSTNHLMGSGYWAWIIPLANNRTSIGLVADPAAQEISQFGNFDKFLSWATSYQPQLADQIYDQKDKLMDFRLLSNLSLNSSRLWSSEGWAITGEAGVFADPFYSPGTDFIAIGNTIITDLITQQRSKTELSVHATIYQKLFHSFHESTLSLYEEQYLGFADTRLMVVKTTWDYAYYWSVLAWLFFRGLTTNTKFLQAAQTDLVRIRTLNETIQANFRARAAERKVDAGQGRFFDQLSIPVLLELNAQLHQPHTNFQTELAENVARLEKLSPLLMAILSETKITSTPNCDLLGDLRSRF
jgi:2-polyprenyl-6-methoxyphenol hydroxylase-like FAD-dependent oxidoreductase